MAIDKSDDQKSNQSRGPARNGYRYSGLNNEAFKVRLEKLRTMKVRIYHQIRQEANCNETIAYYEDSNNTLEDVDPDILTD